MKTFRPHFKFLDVKKQRLSVCQEEQKECVEFSALESKLISSMEGKPPGHVGKFGLQKRIDERRLQKLSGGMKKASASIPKRQSNE